MTAINKQALIAKIKKQTESFDTVVLKEDEVLALVEALEVTEKQTAALFKENVRLKSGIAGLVHLGIRHGDIEVMGIAGDAQLSTPCTDSIIEKNRRWHWREG
ncbi:hypothetical protein [Citrobacter freundii]|uniref:hypothetical protein n=1 Tax=Citrobacter freundii TaxID=546 RepID=UPI0035CA96A1